MKKITSIVLILFLLSPFLFSVHSFAYALIKLGNSNVAHVFLVTKTEDWEPIWPGPFGRVKYQVKGDKFEGLLTLHGLKPETKYVLAINGQGGTSTDDLIYSAAEDDEVYPSRWDGWWKGKDEVPGTEDDEGYYDFVTVISNKGGNLEYEFSVDLPPGTYLWVKFLVKDTTIGWETVIMEAVALKFKIN